MSDGDSAVMWEDGDSDYGIGPASGGLNSVQGILVVVAGLAGFAIGAVFRPDPAAIGVVLVSATLALLLSIFAFTSGPQRVRERLAAAIATFAWAWVMVLRPGPLRSLVGDSGMVLLAMAVAAPVIATVHVALRSGLLAGLRDPRSIYANVRNLTLIYAPLFYVTVWVVIDVT